MRLLSVIPPVAGALAAGIPAFAEGVGLGLTTTACALVGAGGAMFVTTKFQKTRQKVLLDAFADSWRAELHRFDSSIRINIMLARRRIPLVGKRTFEFVHQYNFKPAASDIKLALSVEQGVAGFAFQSKDWAIGDMLTDTVHVRSGTKMHAAGQSLDGEQKTATKHLTLIVSYPLFAIESPRGTGQPAPGNKCIGVLNIDSTMPQAYATYMAPPAVGQSSFMEVLLTDYLPRFTNVVAHVVG